MVPVINSTDEYLRSNAVIAVSIVPSALGVPKLLPFLKPVCKSKDLWWPRHRGCPNSWGDCYFNGKVLATFLIVFGSLIPLMDAVYAIHFAREVMGVWVREFDLPDEQEKQIVLNTVKQFVSVEGMKADYNGFLPEMFKKFLSLDKRS